MSRKVHIGGVPFPIVDYDNAIQDFGQWMRSGVAHQVCIVNVHTLVTAMRDLSFHTIVREAAMATMDGQPLRWYANVVCGAQVKGRVCGPELMHRCLEQGNKQKWRHYLLGGRPEVLEALEKRLHERYPGVCIAGSYSPPFRPATEAEEAEIVATDQ